MLQACSGAVGPVLSRILVVPVCYGPSREVGSSNYIEIGQSSNWLRTDRGLDHHQPLTDIPPHRWRQFLSDCNNFLTGGENWAGRAAELGWNAASLFGCRRARSFAHP